MSTLPSSDPDRQTSGKSPRGERQVDRKDRNPWYRWTIHIGAPMTASLIFHVGAVLLFSLATVAGAVAPREKVVVIKLIEASGNPLTGDLKWSDDEIESLEAPDLDVENLADFSDPFELDVSDFDRSRGIGDSPGLGFGEGRGDVLGIGSGAGEAGSGGFGGFLAAGRRAGVGRVGIWHMSLAANKIAYVIDFSGSITVAQDDLVGELKRSVAKLKAPQAFNVYIFFERGGKYVTQSFKQSLQIATAGTKRSFYSWIDDQVPMGRTEPLDAMRRALKLNPEVIFFLSDGFFDEKFVDQITQANKRVGARIWCFTLDENPPPVRAGVPPGTTDGTRRLERIANRNNGILKIIAR